MRPGKRVIHLAGLFGLLMLTVHQGVRYWQAAVEWDRQARKLVGAARSGNTPAVEAWMEQHRRNADPSAIADAVVEALYLARADAASERPGALSPTAYRKVWKAIAAQCDDPNDPILQHMLCQAAGEGNEEQVRQLLQRGTSVNATELGGFSALERAVICRDRRMVEFLIRKGASGIRGALLLAQREADKPDMDDILALLRTETLKHRR